MNELCCSLSEEFALLIDCARDDVLQRQVSIFEKSVISRKQDEEEGEE